MLVPRTKFGSSLYNVPLLLALRLFYHASPFETAAQPAKHSRTERDVTVITSHDVQTSLLPATIGVSRQTVTAPPPQTQPCRPYAKLSTHDWLAQISAFPALYTDHRLVSLTWTKALASPLSHEYLQFITSDPEGHRTRHLTHRHVDGGDSVLLNYDWTSGLEPTVHHSLPLPLLSLTFDQDQDQAHGHGPSPGVPIAAFARLLVEITARKPQYSLLREMCWWHAEAVFDAAHARWGGKVKEWEFAHLRYSFVVRTSVIRREKLVRGAEEFREGNVRRLVY